MGHYAGEMDGSPGPNHPAKSDAMVLWRSPEGEHPSRTLLLMGGGALGINVSGHVLVMPIERWHELARKGFGTEFPAAPPQ